MHAGVGAASRTLRKTQQKPSVLSLELRLLSCLSLLLLQSCFCGIFAPANAANPYSGYYCDKKKFSPPPRALSLNFDACIQIRYERHAGKKSTQRQEDMQQINIHCLLITNLKWFLNGQQQSATTFSLFSSPGSSSFVKPSPPSSRSPPLLPL